MKKYIKPATKTLVTDLEAFLQDDLGYGSPTKGKVEGNYTKDSEWDDAPDSDW
ncbi:MAG: hypothetical protein LUC49_04445 [Prevotella sp.]|nr:hypothetical protein [Prevotella sp.]MCD8305893.1 hypothetical protein [Prevotella sp.]